MHYQHHYLSKQPAPYPVGKVVCVGRNYAAHAEELNNPIPSQPLLFIKPNTAISPLEQPIQLPSNAGPCHYEGEISLLIGQTLTQAPVEAAVEAIAGIGMALDLTLRQRQSELKQQGHPWEIAKSFDGACPLSDFVDTREQHAVLDQLSFTLSINGQQRQHGLSQQMLWAIPELLSQMSHYFTLLPGDVVLTGTPAGVGPLAAGDQLSLQLQLGKTQAHYTTQVAL